MRKCLNCFVINKKIFQTQAEPKVQANIPLLWSLKFNKIINYCSATNMPLLWSLLKKCFQDI